MARVYWHRGRLSCVFPDCFADSVVENLPRPVYRFGSGESIHVVVKVWTFCDRSAGDFETISVVKVRYASNESRGRDALVLLSPPNLPASRGSCAHLYQALSFSDTQTRGLHDRVDLISS